MKNIVFLPFIILISCGIAFGQAVIKGKIVDEKGESLIGVVVMVKSPKTVATSTDIDGAFTLHIASDAVQIVNVSFIGYQTIADTLFLKKGEERLKNYIMTSESKQMEEVQVTGRAKKSDDKYMESVKAKSVSNIDFISSATMKKTGDANIAAAVSRVTGVSTNGNYIAVRGIGDRYIETSINGLRIPTLDPFTNNIRLDIFPSSLVDNIVISKTASANLPGDWAGAYISIETKDYPDKLMVNFETSWGYNDQSTFKNVLTSPDRSSDDWLGFDGGKNSREYNQNSFIPVALANNSNTGVRQLTVYDEFVAMGLGDYFKSIGVTSQQQWDNSSDKGATYEKLALVELGFLDKSHLSDAATSVAVIDAMNNFSKQDYNKAYEIINKDAVAANNAFPKYWTPVYFKAPLNNSQSLSVGNKLKLFGRSFSYLVGFKYESSVKYDPASTGFTANEGGGGDGRTQQVCKETNGWSGLANLAYEFNNNNKIVLLFMPNLIGINNVREVQSTDYTGTGADVTDNAIINYEERKQLVYQIKSENLIPGPDLKLNTNVSYTQGSSLAPDLINGYGTLVYRYLTENLLDSKLNAELPIFKNSELSKKILFGGSYQKTERDFQQYKYTLPSSTLGSVVGYSFDIDSVKQSNGTYDDSYMIHKYYAKSALPSNHTMGYSVVDGGFAMFDINLTRNIRLSAGERIEHSFILADIYLFHQENLAINDQRRYDDPSGSGTLENPGLLNNTDLLPSAVLIYKLFHTESHTINLKLNYSQTVARPTIREITGVSTLDYELNQMVTGSQHLKEVHISNYDVRLEYSAKSGGDVSLNFFAKDFKDNIYMTEDPVHGYTWSNDIGGVFLKGIEVEGKKNVTKNFEFRANATVDNYKKADQSPPLSGQAPYVINAMLNYSSDSLKLNASLIYNVQGSKLYVVGMGSLPNTYERPRNLLDFKITKFIGKHFSASFTVKNILNAPERYTYRDKYTMQWQEDWNVYHWGTTYNFALAYKL